MTDRTVKRNGKIAELKKARKNHKCNTCTGLIGVDDAYWQITVAGSGLGGIKHPDRACVSCLDRALGGKDDAAG